MPVASRSSTDDLKARIASVLLLLRRRPGMGAESDADSRPIVPPQSVSGRALAIVVGIMAFLASLTAGGVAMVSAASLNWRSDIAREITIQVKPLEEVDLAAETAKALAIARAAPGIGSVRALDDAANAKLLEPWLGTGFDLSDLPVPRLIVAEIADANQANLPSLARRLRAEVRGVVFDDHSAWADRLSAFANGAVLVGVGILLLVFVVTVLSVVFATRGAMAGNRDVISVLHFVGAEDTFIAREFQRHFLMLGLQGGLWGALAAAAFFAGTSLLTAGILSGPDGETIAFLLGRLGVGPVGYIAALAVALAIAAMTAVTSRITVYRFLAEIE